MDNYFSTLKHNFFVTPDAKRNAKHSTKGTWCLFENELNAH